MRLDPAVAHRRRFLLPKGGVGFQEIHQEFGTLEGASGPVKILSGRFGPYITDGKTNVTIPKATNPESITAEQAVAMIKAKEAAGPSKRPFKRKVTKKRTSK